MNQFLHDAVTVLSAKEWIIYALVVGGVFVFIWMMMELEERREVNRGQRKQKVHPRRRKGD